MNFKTKKTKKIFFVFFCISFFMSSSGLSFLTPKKAEAQAYVPVWETGENLITNLATTKSTAFLEWKEFTGDGIIWVIVKDLIKNAIIDVILNEIKDQFGSEPAFVSNPFVFLKELESEISNDVLNDLLDGYFSNSYFGTDIQDILKDKHIPADRQARLDSILESTIEDDITTSGGDYTKFENGNFYEGGWAGFFSLTQNQKNNPYGSYLQAENALSESKKESESLALEELSWGDGFLSDRDNGQITLPGKTIGDQLNEVLGNELRTLENADELSEALAILAGSLISNLFDSGGLGTGGSLTYTTSTGGTATVPDTDDLVDTSMPGGGTSVTLDSGTNCFNIDNGSFKANNGALQGINLDGGDMEMIDPTLNTRDYTIKDGGNTVQIMGTFDIVVATGTSVGGVSGDYITLTDPVITDPEFATLSNSSVDNSGPISDALVTNTPEVDPDLTGEVSFMADATNVCLQNVDLELDSEASSDSDYMEAVVKNGTGNSITTAHIDSIASGDSSLTDDDLLRGGETDPGAITLNNVVLIGGTVDVSGITYDIEGPSSGLYCTVGSSAPCTYPTVSNVTGSGLHIDDTSNTWSIKSIVWSDKETNVSGGFEIFGGTVVGY